MKRDVIVDVRDAVHEAVRGYIDECRAQPGDDHTECDAIAGDLIGELRRRGLTVSKLRTRKVRQITMAMMARAK